MVKNALELLEQSTLRFPDKNVFSEENKALTYTECMKQAKAVGTRLSRLNSKNAPIAVLLDKGVSCLTAMFGVVYSGNFYVIIDSHMPSERIDTIFRTLSPIAVVTDEKNKETAQSLRFDGEIIMFDEAVKTEIDEQKLKLIRSRSIDTDPLYALFTSGSTGVPKGAVVCHRNVIDYAEWVFETFDIGSETVFGNQTPFYFSMSVLDIYTTLKSGAEMVIIPKTFFSFPLKLLEFLNEKKVNTIYWVPSALCLVANWKALDYIELPNLKKILFAGEVMPTKQLNIWISHIPNALYANLYGPTEVTDICAYYIVNRKFRDDEPLPIGNACANCGLLVLKDDGTEAKEGEEGELCVRSSLLAMGYYNNPEKTQAVFTQNPCNTAYPELIYRTGDLVKYNEYGELMFLTRKDFQIKHMGYRIELGEIETAVSAADGVTACVCIYDEEKDKLVLLYEGKADSKAVLKSAGKRLPNYMMPGKIINVKSMPHNANGKIDRKWLKNNYKTLR